MDSNSVSLRARREVAVVGGLLALLFCVIALAGPAAANGVGGTPVWSAPSAVDDELREWAFNADVSMASDGTFWTHWVETEGPESVLIARRYDPSTGWAAPGPVAISASGFGIATLFALPAGGAVSVWVENASVNSASFTPGVGWAPPVTLSATNGTVATFSSVRLASGAYAVHWAHLENGITSRWASVYVSGSGLSAAAPLDFIETSNVTSARMAVDDHGGALAIWLQRDTDGYQYLWMNEFAPGSGWTGPLRADANDSENATTPAISMAADGYAIISWRQDDNGTPVYRYRVKDIGSAWTAVLRRGVATADLPLPVFARFAPNGVGWSVDFFYNATASAYELYATRYARLTGWGVPQRVGIALPTAVDTIYSAPTFDGDSNLFYAWSQATGSNYSAWAVVYRENGGWGAPFELDNLLGTNSMYPWVHVNGPLSALVQWVDYHANNTVSLRVRWFSNATGWGPTTTLVQLAATSYLEASNGLAVDANGNVLLVYGAIQASEYRVFAVRGKFSYEPLHLTITSPTEGLRTSFNSVVIEGTTELFTEVTVMGTPVAVAADGSFRTQWFFNPGTSMITVSARSIYGLTATAWVNVTLEDASVALAEEVAARTEALNATMAALANTTAALSNTSAALAAAQTNLTALQTQLATTAHNLTTTEAALQAARADAAAADATAKADLDSVRGQASLSMVVGILGIAIGAAALALSMVRRKGGQGESAQTPEKAP